MSLTDILINWSEVWALLIPLFVILLYRPSGHASRPLILYVMLAFVLNFFAIFMVQFYTLLPSWMSYNNNILYNIHSIIRVALFSWYIIVVTKHKFDLLFKILLSVYSLLVLANFIFSESVYFLSSRLFAAESIILLIICLFYFLHLIRDESETNWVRQPSFLAGIGISLYEASTFFIFLFFYPLHLDRKYRAFAHVAMKIYLLMFVILCMLLALALYMNRKNRKIIART